MTTVMAIVGAITALGSIVTGVVLIMNKIDALIISLKPTQDQINQKLDAVIATQKQQAETTGRPV